jgi:hypothetical protein
VFWVVMFQLSEPSILDLLQKVYCSGCPTLRLPNFLPRLVLAADRGQLCQDLRTDATSGRGTIYRVPTNGDLEANLRKSCSCKILPKSFYLDKLLRS